MFGYLQAQWCTSLSWITWLPRNQMITYATQQFTIIFSAANLTASVLGGQSFVRKIASELNRPKHPESSAKRPLHDPSLLTLPLNGQFWPRIGLSNGKNSFGEPSTPPSFLGSLRVSTEEPGHRGLGSCSCTLCVTYCLRQSRICCCPVHNSTYVQGESPDP